MAKCSSYHPQSNSSYKNNSKLLRKIIPQPAENLVVSTYKEKEMVAKMIHKTMPEKEEYKSRYRREPEEKLLFHVTSASNVKSIVTDNFDWRRITRGKFGKGTSFSGDAKYANRYANYKIGEERAIIVTKVLVCKTTPGHYGIKIPRKKCDTTIGNNNKVYVKFVDNEILPKYIVFYKSNKNQANKNNKEISQNKQCSKYKPTNPSASNAYSGDNDCSDDEYESDDYEDESDENEDYEEEYEEEYDEICEEEESCEEEEWEDEYDENDEEGEDCEEEEDEDEYDENCEEEEESCDGEHEEYCDEEEEYDESCEEEEEEEYCEEEEEEEEDYDYEDGDYQYGDNNYQSHHGYYN